MTPSILFSILCLTIVQAAPSEELTVLKSEDPQEYQRRMELRPRPTRAGHLRFVGSVLADPSWAPLYIDRYKNGEETHETRRALLDLIYRSIQELPQTIIEDFSQEPDFIRSEIVDLMDLDSIPFEQLERDKSPLVRAALVRRIGKDTERDTDIIIRALHDTDIQVLSDAARAAHKRQCVESIPRLGALALHHDGTVALRALYALSKLDKPFTILLIQKHQLTESLHTNMSLFAQGLLD
jgi:hypothetical protein